MKMVTLDKNQKKKMMKSVEIEILSNENPDEHEKYIIVMIRMEVLVMIVMIVLLNYSNHHFYNFRKTFLCIRKR